jgi:hypothetical protein
MSFLVFCVFDLRNANREDYLYVYMELASIGLRKIVKSENGPGFKLPSTAVLGTFEGESVDEVRSLVGKKVQAALEAHGLHGDFFVVASHDWACAGESL